jgi:hypothetical protein
VTISPVSLHSMQLLLRNRNTSFLMSMLCMRCFPDPGRNRAVCQKQPGNRVIQYRNVLRNKQFVTSSDFFSTYSIVLPRAISSILHTEVADFNINI